MKGEIKWFNNERGYGFIINENQEDIFVHYSEIKKDGYKTLETGDIVEFDIEKGKNGLQALSVSKIA